MKKAVLTIQGQYRLLGNMSLFNFECSALKRRSGGVAQLGEHLLCKQGVIGSIPFISTTRKGKGQKRPKHTSQQDKGS